MFPKSIGRYEVVKHVEMGKISFPLLTLSYRLVQVKRSDGRRANFTSVEENGKLYLTSCGKRYEPSSSAVDEIARWLSITQANKHYREELKEQGINNG